MYLDIKHAFTAFSLLQAHGRGQARAGRSQCCFGLLSLLCAAGGGCDQTPVSAAAVRCFPARASEICTVGPSALQKQKSKCHEFSLS